MQRNLGNRAVDRLFQGSNLQTKLTAGSANDKYEQEADRVAEKIVSATPRKTDQKTQISKKPQSAIADSISPLQRSPGTQQNPAAQIAPQIQPENKLQPKESQEEELAGNFIQKSFSSGGDERLPIKMAIRKNPAKDLASPSISNRYSSGLFRLQRKGTGQIAPPNIESGIFSARGGGKSLSESEKKYFEPRFGADFSSVKLHTGSQANDLARSVNARAFTVGRDIFFGGSQYNSDSTDGRKLMAHELTHTIQQGAVRRKPLQRKTWSISSLNSTIQRKESTDETGVSGMFEVTASALWFHTTKKWKKSLLSKNTKVKVLGVKSGSWVWVIANDEKGYVHRSYLKRIKSNSNPGELTSNLWIVEDNAEATSNSQISKSLFIELLHLELKEVMEPELEGTLYTTKKCPMLTTIMSTVKKLSALHIENMIRMYISSVGNGYYDYIKQTKERAAKDTARWINNEEIELPVFGALPSRETFEQMGDSVNWFLGFFAKSKPGGLQIKSKVSPLQDLGPGQPMESTIRTKMEGAFGTSFTNVRIHNNKHTAQIATNTNVRAFTLGQSIGFGSGEYNPGTPVGDALLAHELAHTIQQKEAAPGIFAKSNISNTSDLEKDADNSAVGAIAKLWAKFKGGAKDIPKEVMPKLKTGLRLQGCRKDSDDKKIIEKKTKVELVLFSKDVNKIKINNKPVNLKITLSIENAIDKKQKAWIDHKFSVQNMRKPMLKFTNALGKHIFHTNDLNGVSISSDFKFLEMELDKANHNINIITVEFAVKGDFSKWIDNLPPSVKVTINGKIRIAIPLHNLINAKEIKKIKDLLNYSSNIKELEQKALKLKQDASQLRKNAKKLMGKAQTARKKYKQAKYKSEQKTYKNLLKKVEKEYKQTIAQAEKLKKETNKIVKIISSGKEKILKQLNSMKWMRKGLQKAGKMASKTALKLGLRSAVKAGGHFIPIVNVLMICWDIYDVASYVYENRKEIKKMAKEVEDIMYEYLVPDEVKQYDFGNPWHVYEFFKRLFGVPY